MKNKEIIFKLLYNALVEIREEAYVTNQPKIFHLADLFHNVPLSLDKAEGTDDYDALMKRIKKHASEKKISEWLNNHLDDSSQ